MASVLRDSAITDIVLSGDTDVVERYGLPPSMVERMTLIMDVFAAPQTRLTLEEVTVKTNLPRSTTHRILEQLVRLRWLQHGASGYGLGPRALGLGGREVGHGALRTAAFPLLHALAMHTDMVVHLAVLDGDDIYYLDKFGGQAATEVPSRVGGRAPAHCTAAGKAMLAWLAPEQVDSQYDGMLNRRTARSIGDLGVLHHELSRIRTRNGLAFERGECFPHLACVGAAVRGPDTPIGAVSIVGDIQANLERLAPLVINTAQAITEQLLGDVPQKPRPRHEPVALPHGGCGEALGQLVAMGERGKWF